jgi:hypothetical protein
MLVPFRDYFFLHLQVPNFVCRGMRRASDHRMWLCRARRCSKIPADYVTDQNNFWPFRKFAARAIT